MKLVLQAYAQPLGRPQRSPRIAQPRFFLRRGPRRVQIVRQVGDLLMQLVENFALSLRQSGRGLGAVCAASPQRAEPVRRALQRPHECPSHQDQRQSRDEEGLHECIHQRIPERMLNLNVDVARVMEQRERSCQFAVPVQRARQDVQRQDFFFSRLISAFFAHKFGLFLILSGGVLHHFRPVSNTVAIPGVIASVLPSAS